MTGESSHTSELHASNVEQQASNTKGRWMLLFLLVFFAAPIVIVLGLHQSGWHPEGKSNGELIRPAKTLQLDASLLERIGLKTTQALWQERWNMVYVSEQCAEQCKQRLYEARQIHVSLAKEIDRVQRVLFTRDQDVLALKDKYPDLIVVNDEAVFLALNAEFVRSGGQGLYLVDPLGHLVMRYSDNVPAKAIRTDILKLLKFSWAG